MKVEIVKDSINLNGDRLTTIIATYPRFIHAEVMTHRLFSRNAASSRAIPVNKMIQMVEQNIAYPIYWGKNQAGMQAAEEVDQDTAFKAKQVWLNGAKYAIEIAKELHALGLHKQLVNRPLEPYMYITTIISSTEWDNFFHLRDTWTDDGPGEAQPEFAFLAKMIQREFVKSQPKQLRAGEWHMPLVSTEDPSHPLFVSEGYDIKRISAARCARISYLTHDGVRDYDKDIEMCAKLVANGHWSPLEHVAEALNESKRIGNFIGWKQFRKYFKNEHYGRNLEK